MIDLAAELWGRPVFDRRMAAVILLELRAGELLSGDLITFRGRDWVFLVVVALLVVPLQIALIPVARLYDITGLFGTIPGVVLIHVAFGLPFAIFLLRNFFIGIPAELLEAALGIPGRQPPVTLRGWPIGWKGVTHGEGDPRSVG